MDKDYRAKNLRFRSFKSEDLTGCDFCCADVRGADFSGAVLIGANFTSCRTGLQRRWVVALAAGAICTAIVFGFASGFASAVPAFYGRLPVEEFAVLQRRILPVIALAVLASIYIVLWLRGIGVAFTIFAVVTAIVALGAVVIPAEITASNLILLLGIGTPIASSIAIAAAIVLFVSISEGKRGWIIVGVAFVAALPSMWEGTRGFTPEADPPTGIELALCISVAIVVMVLILTSSVRIARKAMSSDQRFNMIRIFAINLLSRGATNFREADLTGANFSNAVLAHSDFRDATLVHTNWSDARQAEYARTERTYLAYPQICRLVTMKDGYGGNFDNLDLAGINLVGANLGRANFRGANLSNAILQQADLSNARLVHAHLHDADLRNACLTGACIEGWGISSKTKFADIDCDFVYMRSPTPGDLDPWRKPDNKQEIFHKGDFVDFITPFKRTLDLYQQQYIDPRSVGRAYKTLDIFHHDDINPVVCAIALQKLAEQYPDAELEIVTMEGRGKGKIRLQAKIVRKVDQAAMSAHYDAVYDQIVSLPQEDLESLLAGVHANERTHQIENMIHAATLGNKVYLEWGLRLYTIALHFSANPSGTDKLMLDEEIRAITKELRKSKRGGLIRLIPELAARPGDVREELRYYVPQIVHFSAHGSPAGQIYLQDEQGGAQPVSAEALKMLFTNYQDDLRLVVLNACYSNLQAEAIAEVIDCVIGMNDRISDVAAIKFVTAFYGALAFGRSIQAAFLEGKAALPLENIPGEQTPQLIVGNGVDADAIVFTESILESIPT